MSRASVIAKRYATALFEVAKQENNVSAVEEELKSVVAALNADPAIQRFLGFPNIAAAKKIELLKNALAGKVSQPVLNTLDLLVERGRQDAIAQVSEAYSRIAGEALMQADATVYTAKPLSEVELAKVEAQFGAIVGKRIRATQVEDPSLLGGVKVRIGDRLYDGSLSGKLARLEKALQSQAL